MAFQNSNNQPSSLLQSTLNRASTGQRRSSNNQQNAGQERVKADCYANIVMEINGELVQLPFGLAIDTMNEASTRGQNEEYLRQAHARNNFLRQLQNLSLKLSPGEELVLPDTFKVVLRRVNDDAYVPNETNELVSGVDDAFANLFK